MRSFFDGIYAVLSQNLFCCNLHCFVVIPVSSRFTHFLCGEKLQPECCPWRKNDKYHVCRNAKMASNKLGVNLRRRMIIRVNMVQLLSLLFPNFTFQFRHVPVSLKPPREKDH